MIFQYTMLNRCKKILLAESVYTGVYKEGKIPGFLNKSKLVLERRNVDKKRRKGIIEVIEKYQKVFRGKNGKI